MEKSFLTTALLVIGITLLLLTTLQLAFPASQPSDTYNYLETTLNHLLTALILALLTTSTHKCYRDHPLFTLLLGGAIGSLFFIHVLGLRLIDPRQVDWVMNGDWAWHFMGWHFFREEPWQWPLGRIKNFYAPMGTAIGYTDSLPLFAFLFKPLSPWLPPYFQYIGLWIFLGFMLQGVFAGLLLRLVTNNLFLQALGISFFVIAPILLGRVGHDTLVAHWLLLAGLWLYFRPWSATYSWQPFTHWAILMAISAWVHPYLTAMLMGLVIAFYGRWWLIDKNSNTFNTSLQLLSLLMIIGILWWQAGFFIIPSQEMASSGLGYYSMNFLAPLNAMGWSKFLQPLPFLHDGQYDGFNYLGLGVWILILWAIYEFNRQPVSRIVWLKLSPLLIICFLFTLLALSNKISIGSLVLVELQGEFLKIFTPFRSSGRFFWVVGYLIVFLTIALLIVRNHTKKLFIYFLFALSIQLIELQTIHHGLRYGWGPETQGWDNPLKSKTWQEIAPHYRKITLIVPVNCGEPAADYLPFAFLAGRYQLQINTGIAARVDVAGVGRYCTELLENIYHKGLVEDEAIYIVRDDLRQQWQTVAKSPLHCRQIDGFYTCVTQKSYQQHHFTW